MTMKTVLDTEQSIAAAQEGAAAFHLPLTLFTLNPLTVEAVRLNRTDRCYHCKKTIFTRFLQAAEQQGIKHLIDGTNADDLQVYRPGRKALRELGVISPLAQLGIDKQTVRRLAAELGLKTATQPAAPCLATRFNYNTQITPSMIKRVAQGERLLKELIPQLADFRLRVHGNLARIEVTESVLPALLTHREQIVVQLRDLGFEFVTLDLQGFRSGCYDTHLPAS